MDQLARIEGTAVPSVLEPTFQIFVPLLVANASEILSVPRKTYSYGAHPRQNLDIYSSPTVSGETPPILIFLYGGGLIAGDKILLGVPHSLIYHNLGSFFAQRGFTTIIPDYRRVYNPRTGTDEGATFPTGGEDIAAILEWLSSPSSPLKASSQQCSLFLMGNSAGGVHLGTYLFETQFKNGRKRIFDGSNGFKLRGAVLLSVPFDFKCASPQRSEMLDQYWPTSLSGSSSSRSHELFCPSGLLSSTAERIVAGKISDPADLCIPSTLVLLCEYDPEDEIIDPGTRFCAVWKQVFGSSKGMELKWIGGHNHISPALALMSGDVAGEQWGEDVVEWMKGIMGRDV